MTKSEEIFEYFCLRKGIAYEHIEEGIAKSPDYLISIQGKNFVVEVKQMDPNQEERSILLNLLDDWYQEDIYHWGIPGERIRKKISDAVPQLKGWADLEYPTLLVIMNNVDLWPELADEYAVQVAMYGIEVAVVSSEVAPDGGAKILSRWHGPRKKLSPEHNTTLGGIAIMALEQSDVDIKVCHNYHAAVPLPRHELAQLDIRQFEMPFDPRNGFLQWREIA